jgi:ectoine hydroxylase-related dioxygenase (phytanoyl-CoA dioxygenase family)
MLMTKEQVKAFEEEGYAFLPEYLSLDEVNILKSQIPSVFGEDSPRRVIEKDYKIVRSVYGSHATNEVFNRLTRHPKIVGPAMQILDSSVYVYQFKINAKAAFGGDVWEWHQDYIFWQQEDGMKSARVVNVAIFLDEVNEFNGPVFLVPNSHKEGVISVPARDVLPNNELRRHRTYENSPAWISNLTADLKYSLDHNLIRELANKYGMVAPKGPAGSVLFFHANLVHGSPNNISPFDRVAVFVTFNSVDNIPTNVEHPRPEFLVSRDYSPIAPLSDDALFFEASAALPLTQSN